MQVQKLAGIFLKILDFLIMPLLIIILLHEPNFAVGHLDHLEAGVYLSNIDSVLAGKIPYRDFFVSHGLFHLYFQALFFNFFGCNIYNLFLFFYSTGILTYLIFYFLLRTVLKTRLCLLMIFFMALVETYHPFWMMRTGYFRIGFSLITIFMFFKFLKKEEKQYLFWAGFFSILSLFYSIDFGSFIIFSGLSFLLFYSIYFFEKNVFLTIRNNCVIYFLGVAVLLIPFSFYLYYNRAFYDYFYVNFYVTPKYFLAAWSQRPRFFIHKFSDYSNIWQLLKSQSFQIYLPLYIYLSIFLYFGYLHVLHKKISKEDSILVLLTIFGLMTYKASFRAVESAQFQLAILPLFIVIGIIAEKIYFTARFNMQIYQVREKPMPLLYIKSIFYSFVIVLIIFYFIYSEKRYYQNLNGWLYYQLNKSEFISSYMFPFPKKLAELRYCREPRMGKMLILSKEADDFEGVTDFIRSNTKPHEIVFSFPEHCIYNFLAQRPCLGRFYVAGLAHTFLPWQEEMVRELKIIKPQYIIYGRGLSNLAASIESKQELLPEVRDYINKHYQVIRQFKTVNIYQWIHAKSD